MHVVNIHKRTIPLPKEKVGALLDSLGSEGDRIWPYECWPKIFLNKGLCVGSDGGHKPIRYEIVEYSPNNFIKFKFSAPKGFDGFHQLLLKDLGESKTEVQHLIDMRVSGSGLLNWYVIILHLHNALLRDLLAKVQASLGIEPEVTPWSPWVKFLRWLFSGGKSNPKKRPYKNS